MTESQQHLNSVFESRRLAQKAMHQVALTTGVSSLPAVNPGHYQRQLHSAVLQFHSDVALKKKAIGDLWDRDRPLDTVTVPPSTARVQVPWQDWSPTWNEHLDDDWDPWQAAPTVQREVALDSLQEVWGMNDMVQAKLVVDGEVKQIIAAPLALPPRSARAVMNSLDECIEKLGWSTDENPGDYRSEKPGL